MNPIAQPFRRSPSAALLDVADIIADPVEPATFPSHTLRWRNDRAADAIGLADLSDADWIRHFGQFAPFAESLPTPLALRYHGHQFGVYNPDIGDGRGFTFAQFVARDGRLLELGTKGSGTTPYSRFGDGRLTLKGAVREVLATEMLAALGVPTSQTLSIIETGEALQRHDEPSPTRSAVLVRMSHGHIRIGTFQRLAALENAPGIARLVRYVLTHLHGHDVVEVNAWDDGEAAARMLTHTVDACAKTTGRMMAAGFVHGVLNTDNINVTGESFDYGPWRFAPQWDPGFVAAYFDEGGRYAFGRQPAAVHWNLGQLAVALRLLAESEPLIAALERFDPTYETAVAEQFVWRLRRRPVASDVARDVVAAAEPVMRARQVQPDRFFFDAATGRDTPRGTGTEETAWSEALTRLGPPDPAMIADPYWSGAGPVTMLIDEVEALWAQVDAGDWRALDAKIAAIRAMGRAMDAPHTA